MCSHVTWIPRYCHRSRKNRGTSNWPQDPDMQDHSIGYEWLYSIAAEGWTLKTRVYSRCVHRQFTCTTPLTMFSVMKRLSSSLGWRIASIMFLFLYCSGNVANDPMFGYTFGNVKLWPLNGDQSSKFTFMSTHMRRHHAKLHIVFELSYIGSIIERLLSVDRRALGKSIQWIKDISQLTYHSLELSYTLICNYSLIANQGWMNVAGFSRPANTNDDLYISPFFAL